MLGRVGPSMGPSARLPSGGHRGAAKAQTGRCHRAGGTKARYGIAGVRDTSILQSSKDPPAAGSAAANKHSLEVLHFHANLLELLKKFADQLNGERF